jgi:ribosome-associated heat shock protein Hsp15
VKHRSTATELVEGGQVRLNRVKVSKPGHALREGDVLTLTLNGEIRVVKVLGAAEKRGPAAAARLLYEDMAVQQIPSSQAENLGA